MPKISAVMALYNTPYDLLQKTVESILTQTFSDFELIVIDDASQMEYEDLFNKFEDKRIKYSKLEENAGPGNARNVGIKKAIGEYIAIVDSDDIYLPKRFEVQAQYLDKNPDISLVSCAYKQSDNSKIPSIVENNDDIKIGMLFNSMLANPAVMLRKTVFEEKNVFYPQNINFGEDYHLWMNAMFAGEKMANLKDVLMIYTRRKNQLSKTKSEKQVSILKEIYLEIFSRMGVETSEKEIDLHYNIYLENFTCVSIEEASNWFDKIIAQNKISHIFDEKKLIEKKNSVLNQINRFKNRIFKIKIGQNNLCIYKPCTILLEKRN